MLFLKKIINQVLLKTGKAELKMCQLNCRGLDSAGGVPQTNLGPSPALSHSTGNTVTIYQSFTTSSPVSVRATVHLLLSPISVFST